MVFCDWNVFSGLEDALHQFSIARHFLLVPSFKFLNFEFSQKIFDFTVAKFASF